MFRGPCPLLTRDLLLVLLMVLLASCTVGAPQTFGSLESTETIYVSFLDANSDLFPDEHLVSSRSGERDLQGSRCPDSIPARGVSIACSGLNAYYTRAFFPTDANGSFINVTVLLFEDSRDAQRFFDQLRSELGTGPTDHFVMSVSYDEPTINPDWTTIDRSESAHLQENVVLTSEFVSGYQPVEIVDYNRLRADPVCEVQLGCRSDAECGPRGTCSDEDSCVRECAFS